MVPPHLPPELVSRILHFVVPASEPSIYPSTDAISLAGSSGGTSRPPRIPAPHLQTLCNACLVSRDILPYARRLLYRSIVVGGAKQMRFLARTLEGKSISEKELGMSSSSKGEYEDLRGAYSLGSLVHPEMLLALGLMTMPSGTSDRERTAPKANGSIASSDAGDSDDALLCSPIAIAASALRISSFVQHVCLLHYDACLASGDQLTDTYAWEPSLRALFSHASQLQTVSFFARLNGQTMEQFFHSKTTCNLRRLTVQFLGYSESRLPYSTAPSEPLLSNLTQLHLNQTIPTGDIVSQLISRTTCTSALQVLRLSRLKQDALFDLSNNFDSFEEQAKRGLAPGDELPQSRMNYARAATAATKLNGHAHAQTLQAESDRHLSLPPSARLPTTWQQVGSIKSKVQLFLWHLLRGVQHFPHLRMIMLELGDSRPLDPPTPPTLRFANMVGTPVGEQFVSALNDGPLPPPGQLATLDFPADIPLGINEAEAWDAEEERRRTIARDAYWLDVRHGKEALKEFAHQQIERVLDERRRQALDGDADAQSSGDEEYLKPTVFRSEGERIEIRVVAARPGGWNRFETQVDFEAQVSHLEDSAGASASGPEEQTSFGDPDVFQLAEERWQLGYAPIPQDPGRGFTPMSGKVPKYWLGVLPRVKAADGMITPGGAAVIS